MFAEHWYTGLADIQDSQERLELTSVMAGGCEAIDIGGQYRLAVQLSCVEFAAHHAAGLEGEQVLVDLARPTPALGQFFRQLEQGKGCS